MESKNPNQSFHWQVHADAAALVAHLIDEVSQHLPALTRLKQLMLDHTGTRLMDWIDHFFFGVDPTLQGQLEACGFESVPEEEGVWRHAGGLFPDVLMKQASVAGLALKVESVDDFLFSHAITALVEGEPDSQLRRCVVWEKGRWQCVVVERHGYGGYEPQRIDMRMLGQSVVHGVQLKRVRRIYDDVNAAFDELDALVDASTADIGCDWTCDLFFAAERAYWQSRNHAARIQKARQDALGLGWANHDHHTYRSSREHFARLIGLLEKMGFVCRERFYGGAEAGWGAQVLEQTGTGIVVFADVDMSPEEVMGDFAHEGLPQNDDLGTVGLWCKLHGEAIFEAGMHHLECQFDYRAAVKQLAVFGIETMSPFTDLPHLKQAFTKGQRWPIRTSKIKAALDAGAIDQQQADRFRQEGAIGSHLEILERNGGYKGFNQSGISEIIRQTDPRGDA